MNPIERALSILLLLGRRRLLPATDLAGRFEVSVRTIYRDIDRLIGLGVPVEAERGASGGFRLSAEFLAPPIALNRVETTAILVALALMRGLRATPLQEASRSGGGEAARGAAAGGPRYPRQGLALCRHRTGARRHFSPRAHSGAAGAISMAPSTSFWKEILTQRRVELVHRGSSRTDKVHDVEPHGLLFDRNLWYLVGRSLAADEIRMYRADRVLSATVTGMAFRPQRDFDIRTMLGRQWLEQAMRSWDKSEEGTQIRISVEAAERLKRDWYFRHAKFAKAGEAILMTIPDTDPGTILPLVRWLGPEAELLSPQALRDKFSHELEAIRPRYA